MLSYLAKYKNTAVFTLATGFLACSSQLMALDSQIEMKSSHHDSSHVVKKGPRGPTGPTGPIGPQGIPGPTGACCSGNGVVAYASGSTDSSQTITTTQSIFNIITDLVPPSPNIKHVGQTYVVEESGVYSVSILVSAFINSIVFDGVLETRLFVNLAQHLLLAEGIDSNFLNATNTKNISGTISIHLDAGDIVFLTGKAVDNLEPGTSFTASAKLSLTLISQP